MYVEEERKTRSEAVDVEPAIDGGRRSGHVTRAQLIVLILIAIVVVGGTVAFGVLRLYAS